MKRLSSQVALLLAFQAAVLALLVERPPTLAVLTGLAALFWLTAPRGRWRGLVLAGLLLGTWSVVVSQGLFYGGEPRTALWRLAGPGQFPFGDPPGLYIYREGLWHGLVQALRFNVMILLGAGLLARYAADELVGGLRALRVPVPLCFLFSIALRFLPLLWEEARATWTAQHLRGYRLAGVGGLAAAARVLALPLLAANVRKADEIAAALAARGFAPLQDAPMPPRPAPARERALAWGGALALLALAALLLLTRAHLHGLWTPEGLDELLAWVDGHV